MQINDNLAELMYEAGLTAEGGWDELDEYNQEAVLRLIRLVVYRATYLAAVYADPHEQSSGIRTALNHFGV